MKYALIGCGRIAPNHIKAALAAADRGLEIAAICDIVPEKAEALAERFELGDVPRYTDYKKCLPTSPPGSLPLRRRAVLMPPWLLTASRRAAM